MKLIAGTRGSALALAQTDIVIEKLKNAYPEVAIEKKIILTVGDKILDKALDKIGDKGIFVSEIESNLLSGEIDFAVHSMKDMPSEIDERLVITKTPDRTDSRDILVVNPKYNLKEDEILLWLKASKGLKIGTGSKRRKCQLKIINDSIEDVLIRGNINTRLKKLVEEDLDAIVIAAAGIKRLNLVDINVYYFDYDEMIPSPAQGALAIEVKKDNIKLIEMINSLSDEDTNIKVGAERSFMKHINGGCHKPVGAVASLEGDILKIRGIYGDGNCKHIVCDEIEGNKWEFEQIGKSLAEKMILDLERKMGINNDE